MNRIDDLIRRYFEDTVSDHERLELLRLIQSGRVGATIKDKIAETLRRELRIQESPDLSMQEKGEDIFKLILTNSAHAQSQPSRDHRKVAKLVSIGYRQVIQFAAAVVILGVVGLLLYTNQSPEIQKTLVHAVVPASEFEIVNAGSVIRNVSLNDGSTVVLQPGSEIRYAKKFGNIREVYLSGDAFFEVAKDPNHPFFVYTNEITTKVLGTSFRIRANRNEKEIIVAVKTGKVSVLAGETENTFSKVNAQEITLTPNQQAIYRRNEQVVVKQIVEEPQVVVGQPSAKSSYINEPIISILKNLSESYGLDIQFNEEGLEGCTLTSDAIEGEGLFDQLDIICNALGGTYIMQNDASIVIEANGCKSNVKP
jgi:transmembrane sensor